MSVLHFLGQVVGPALVLANVIAISQSTCTSQDRSLTVQNLAPRAREEWIAVTVPFAEGAVRGTPDLHVDGLPTVWQPIGATWPDGSLRQAVCMFYSELGAHSEISPPLLAGVGPEVPAFQYVLTQPECEFEVTVGGKTTVAKPKLVEVIEDNAARKVVLMRTRIGQTGLVGEFTLEIYSGQEHAYCGVGVFFSDPSTVELECHVQRLAIRTTGHALCLRHAKRSAVETTMTDTGSEVVLLTDTVLGDGQGVRRAGTLVPPLSGTDLLRDSTLGAAIYCKPLGATSWRETGAFGAFGYTPTPPPWLEDVERLRAAFARRHQDFTDPRKSKADPFQVGAHMAGKTPGESGDPPDLGVVQLEAVASTGIPSFLLEVEFSVLQEACRPVHFFEANAEPVAVVEHPTWAISEGRTHPNAEMSADRLGKPDDTPRFETHGWRGKSRQFWSSNYLCAYFLLTGDPQALLEIRNEVRLFLAAETVRPGLMTSSAGEPHALGRMLHTATWLYLCTGDAAIRERMIERVETVALPQWRESCARIDGEIQPFRVYPPEPGQFDGTSPFWPAWKDAVCVMGLAAVHRLTGNPAAKELADGLALSVLEHGWSPPDHPLPQIVYAMKWTGGARLPRDRYSDPDWVRYSNNISIQGMPALEWARQAAHEAQRNDLATRAETLLRGLRARRSPPLDRWFDRFGEWDSVRAVVGGEDPESVDPAAEAGPSDSDK